MVSRPSQRALLFLTTALLVTGVAEAARPFNYRDPPHSYFEHSPTDRLAQLQVKIAAGQVELDTSSDRAFLQSLLAALDVPESSQLLVFSATSLQSEIIRPRNPRALYFNEDTYVGFVPGGVLEVAAIDPEMGPMFYVFDRVRPGRIPAMARSQKCFNCHAGTATNYVPGLIAESVLVSPAGSSLKTYRHDVQGHQIPLVDRFGGWHLTGGHHLTQNHANVGGTSEAGKITLFDVSPGQLSDLSTYLRPTSDILPHLLHEHQLGFENRLFQASYLLRQRLHEGGGRLTREAEAEIDDQATELARYILFADEAELPRGGIEGDPDFVRDFLRNRLPDGAGRALKDLDLSTRLFRYRCSYMLYTDSWKDAPSDLKQRVYRQMASGLREGEGAPGMNHLPQSERIAIRELLKETLPGLPPWWR